MLTATLLLAFLLVVCGTYYIFSGTKIKRHGNPLKRSPNSLPIIGNGILFLQSRHRLFGWFVKCEQQFGFETFQIYVPTLPPGVVTNDPKNVEFVFKNEGIFAKGAFFKKRSWDLFGNGIINADGDLWKIQRRAGLQFLNNANLKVLTDVALPKYLKETVTTLNKSYESQTVVDLEEIFHELTTQIMGRMAYDMEIHNTDSFSKAFDYASGATSQRFQNPIWQLTELVFGNKFRHSVNEVKKFGSTIVSKAIKSRQTLSQRTINGNIDARDPLQVTSGSLINSLLDSIQDEDIVADAALNYLSAGRDTTAQALTWTFYLLMRHPSIVVAIRSEVSDFVAQATEQPVVNKPSIHDSSLYRPTSLPFVTAVFYEALRLFPPVPFELKQCEEATTLPDGTYLPKASIIMWCTWAMNRSKTVWGNDSHEFKPSRWLKNGVLISKTAYEYPVFNGGSRTCLGKKMAEIVAVQVIATLASQFDFQPLDDKERISKNSLTLPMNGGLPCRVKGVVVSTECESAIPC